MLMKMDLHRLPVMELDNDGNTRPRNRWPCKKIRKRFVVWICLSFLKVLITPKLIVAAVKGTEKAQTNTEQVE